MSIKKTVTIAAAAGALAAISVPAMALENEFHGTYSFSTIFSNFQSGGSGDYAPNAKPDNVKMNNYFEQRARLQYIAKASDDLKLVTQFELDTRFGGITNNKYTNSNDSGLLDSDGISLETKHVYLDFNLGKSFNTKLGIQPYKDTIKGLFIDADLPAIMTTTKAGAYTLGLGFSRFSDDYQLATTTTNRLGDGAKDLFVLDNTFAFSKDAKAALSYYFLADYTGSAAYGSVPAHLKDQALLLHTFALSGEGKVGPLTLSGFGAMQAGHMKQMIGKDSAQLHGWAANVAAKMAVGPGTAKVAGLFVSGNNADTGNGTSSYKGWITPLNSYNEGGMMILTRNTANSPSSTDAYIRKTITNVALLSMGYDANLTQKVYLNGNVGFGFVPASAGAPVDKKTGKANSSDFMGTEINLESGYKVSDNLTLRAQAAYMILGGYYKGSASNSVAAKSEDPENPYTMRLMASFKF